MADMTCLMFFLVAAAISEAWDFQAISDSSFVVQPGSPQWEDQIPFGLATFLGSSGEHIARLEAQMKPLFEALPKNGGGGLDPASAKYALERHFLVHHRWRIQALGLPKSQVDDLPVHAVHIAHILEDGTHFGLRELAALAAAVEKSVRIDSAELLSKALAVHGFLEQDLDEDTQDLVIQTFMLFYVLPDSDYSKQTSETIQRYLGLAQRVYPAWTDTLKWVQHLKRAVRSERSTLQDFVEDIVFGYPHFFDNQCSSLRDLLLKVEQPGTGRVLLSKLRNASFADRIPNSIWQFSESNEELRTMGVLDESDQKRNAIMIPNYILAESNCLPSSQIVSICCRSECDELLTGLEGQLRNPSASAQQLSDWTRALSPNVSEALLEQLEEVANSHGGKLLIHSNEFAQWMHSVFPTKCPHPQVAAVTVLTTEEWWPSVRQALRSVALLIAAASAVAGLLKTVRSQKTRGKDKKVD